MMTSVAGTVPGGNIAIRALGRSVLINMVAPGVLYAVCAPRLAHGSLAPLAIAGLPPIIWLVYSLVRLRAVDLLGLFALENVIVRIAALLLAHNEQDALVGRVMENVLLAAMFVGSLCLARPLMFYMSRQLSTGNDPARRREFDRSAAQPKALAVFRALTLGWTGALLVKAAGGYLLATHCSTAQYLLLSPVWDIVSDGVLLFGTIAYGKRRLTPSAVIGQTTGVHA